MRIVPHGLRARNKRGTYTKRGTDQKGHLVPKGELIKKGTYTKRRTYQKRNLPLEKGHLYQKKNLPKTALTAISIEVVPKKREKVECERERLIGKRLVLFPNTLPFIGFPLRGCLHDPALPGCNEA